jgi:hypothetical protein
VTDPKLNSTETHIITNNNFVALVRERTIPTERPPLVGEVSANLLRIEDYLWSAQRIPTAVFSVFSTGAATMYFFQVRVSQLYKRGSVDPVTDPLLIRKSRSAGNRTRICSHAHHIIINCLFHADRLCGLLVVRVLGYRSGGPGSIPGTTRKRDPLSLVSTTEELLDRKVAAPV